jgi:hypothetical protein
MKFVISFLLLIGHLQAAPINIFHEAIPSKAEIVKGIFSETYKIPEDLMSMGEVQICEEIKSRGKLDVCLKKNGDLYVVSVDKGFVHESLKIFSAP